MSCSFQAAQAELDGQKSLLQSHRHRKIRKKNNQTVSHVHSHYGREDAQYSSKLPLPGSGSVKLFHTPAARRVLCAEPRFASPRCRVPIAQFSPTWTRQETRRPRAGRASPPRLLGGSFAAARCASASLTADKTLRPTPPLRALPSAPSYAGAAAPAAAPAESRDSRTCARRQRGGVGVARATPPTQSPRPLARSPAVGSAPLRRRLLPAADAAPRSAVHLPPPPAAEGCAPLPDPSLPCAPAAGRGVCAGGHGSRRAAPGTLRAAAALGGGSAGPLQPPRYRIPPNSGARRTRAWEPPAPPGGRRRCPVGSPPTLPSSTGSLRAAAAASRPPCPGLTAQGPAQGAQGRRGGGRVWGCGFQLAARPTPPR